MTESILAAERQPEAGVQIVLPCTDLDAAIAFYTGLPGFRLDMIMPADAPRIALLSGHGLGLRLEVAEPNDTLPAPLTLRLAGDQTRWAAFGVDRLMAPDGVRIELLSAAAPVAIPAGTQEFILSRATADGTWVSGRAGMQYRDLIPARLGGRYIASHICIPEGGPVPDYVHFHRVGFQMIFCKRGWVRVVYEDQGPPFVMHAGDCVLQPPTIRHRVLEASPGLEVFEISCPAEHETWRDHDLELPSPSLRPDRLFGGQRFARHVAAEAIWQSTPLADFQFRDTGISQATQGLASVRVLRYAAPGSDLAQKASVHDGDFFFMAVLHGTLDLVSEALGRHALGMGDACVIPSGADYRLVPGSPCEVLEVALPGTARPVASSGR